MKKAIVHKKNFGANTMSAVKGLQWKFSTEEEKKAGDRERKLARGCKEFMFGEVVIIARNLRNAKRKFNNL